MQYRNRAGERGRFRFLGLRDLWVISDDLEHGAEPTFQERYVSSRAVDARAQPVPAASAEDVALELKEKLRSFRSGSAVIQQGSQRVRLGFFGGGLECLVADSPEALEAARAYRTQRLVGLSLLTLGMVSLTMGVIGGSPQEDPSDIIRDGLAEGLRIGGAVVTLVGFLPLALSARSLTDAVHRYNAGLLNRYLPEGQKVDLRASVGPRGGGVRLGYRF